MTMHPLISSNIDQFEGDAVALKLKPDYRIIIIIIILYKPLILWKCFNFYLFGVWVQEKGVSLGLNYADMQGLHWFPYHPDANTWSLIKMY